MAKYIVVQGIRIAKDFVPETFGRLTTIGPKFLLPAGAKRSRRAYQVCVCSCGNVGVYTQNCLKLQQTRSCGCLKNETIAARQAKHKMTKTTEYASWAGMTNRCKNKNNKDYARYGGRGISVHPDWLATGTGFQAFFDYMGPKPTPEHEIDRYPDPDGNYEPGNVRWATRKEQNRNKDNNHVLTYNGKTQCLGAWAQDLGIHRTTLFSRLKKLGWSIEKAMSTPARKKPKI